MNRLGHFFGQLRDYAPQRCLEGDGCSFTYAQLLEEIDSWRQRLDNLAVDPGTVVGLRTDYSLAAVAAVLALFARRAIVALIPRSGDATQYLVDAHAAALLEMNIDGSFQWRRLSQATDHPLLQQLRVAGEGGVIIFTSGSTGRPKAALLGVERFLYKFRRPGRRFRTLAFLLFDHVAGLDTLFYTLANGGTLIFTRSRDPMSIIELIESHRVEVLPASPSFLRLMLAAGNTHEHDLSSLKIVTYGSEPMDASTLTRLSAQFPNAQISQKYGTTETGSPRSVSRGNDSLWLKIKREDVEVKVVDGVLWMRSEGTMLGYLNAPSPLDDEGWYCTGDLVDSDGDWIRFRGREADIINVGGEKVAPVEVEQSILELDFVRDALVTGSPHPLLGQIVTARVTLTTPDHDPKEVAKRIRLHCRGRLAPYKVPVKITIEDQGFVNERHKANRGRRSEPN
jgi:acyl-coenzyme A synthetase/AMP-(fatty) acid ligase